MSLTRTQTNQAGPHRAGACRRTGARPRIDSSGPEELRSRLLLSNPSRVPDVHEEKTAGRRNSVRRKRRLPRLHPPIDPCGEPGALETVDG